MKIPVKMIVFWIAALALFTGSALIYSTSPPWLQGVPGLFLTFFLAYCTIIIVAQTFSFIELIRRLRSYPRESAGSSSTEVESA